MNKKLLYSLVLAASMVVVCYADNLSETSPASASVDSKVQPAEDIEILTRAVDNVIMLLPSSGDVTLKKIVHREIRADKFAGVVDALITEMEYSPAKRVEVAEVLHGNFDRETMSTREILDNMGDVGTKPTRSDMQEALDNIIINGGTEEIASLRDAILDYFTQVVAIMNSYHITL